MHVGQVHDIAKTLVHAIVERLLHDRGAHGEISADPVLQATRGIGIDGESGQKHKRRHQQPDGDTKLRRQRQTVQEM